MTEECQVKKQRLKGFIMVAQYLTNGAFSLCRLHEQHIEYWTFSLKLEMWIIMDMITLSSILIVIY